MGSGTSLPPGGATVPDDETYRLFLSSSFQPADLRRIRGQSEPVPARYGERKQFLAEEGSKPWAEWRAAEVGQLYAELAAAVNEASPGAKLLVTTPNLQEGPARVEALRVDRLGLSPSDVWKSLGLDLAAWPAESPGLVVLRTIAGSPREPLRDHATHSDLDRPVALRKERGVILGHRESFAQGAMELAAIPTTHESMGDEQLAHGLAAIDPHWTIVSGTVVASQEERLGRYARVIRPLPSEPPIGNVSGRQDSGIRTRVWTSGGETLIAIANDTPYRVLLENNLEGPADASVTDLGRRQRLLPAIATNGGRSLVLELPPFGVQTIAVASPHVAVQTQAPFLPGLAQLDAEADVISDRLARLAAATHETSTLPNPGCEPVSGTSESPAETRAGSDAQPPGWAAIGDAKAELVADLETPHSGRAAARLRASALPASAVTEQFRPPPDPKLTMRAWLRAQKPQTRVRIWIEGESLGRPITRSLEWSATADWTELRVQAVDLPAVGLEQVRLRFELLDPGTLWIDDVAISGENESSDAGRRAQRELTAALQAYRERRFSDFARLSRSPWARASIQAVSENPPVRTGSAAGSDLPPTRRFR
jgi:hypothetical protein